MWDRIKEPSITTLLNPNVRKVLQKPSKKVGLGALAQRVVETQLRVYNANKNAAPVVATGVPKIASSLFDATLERIADQLGEDDEEDLRLIEAIPEGVVRRAVWKWEKLPVGSHSYLSCQSDMLLSTLTVYGSMCGTGSKRSSRRRCEDRPN